MLETPSILSYLKYGDNATGADNQQERFYMHVICEVCGTEKKRDKNQMLRNKRNFCSRACYEVWWKENVWGRGEKNSKWKPKITVTCLSCEKQFEVAPSRKDKAKFCSYSCRARHYFTGHNNPLWKDGVSGDNKKFRRSAAYAEWRNSIYRRDRWTCQKCGYKGKQLIAHHIKKFSDYPELRLELSNGITLCRKCHASIENPQRAYDGLGNTEKMCSGLYGDIERVAEMTIPSF